MAVTAIVGILMEDWGGVCTASGDWAIQDCVPTTAWIGAAINAGTKALGGITKMVGGAVGAAMANKQAKRANEELSKGQQYLDDWYNAAMATDILDRADSRSMLAAYREAMDENQRKYAQNAIKGGATEEAQVAYAQAANKGYADAISKISAQGQAIKDNVSQAYMQGKIGYHNALADNYMQAGKAMGQAVTQGFNAAGDALSGAALTTNKDGMTGTIGGSIQTWLKDREAKNRR